jgi:plasmid stabilization system protein ParE
VDEGEAAFRWYEARNSDAALAFELQLDRAVRAIEEAPERFPRIQGETRRALVIGFPFSMVFRVRGDEIRVLAIAHTRRRHSDD